MATEDDQQKGVGLDISWKHTTNRRLIKFQLGDSHITLSHPMTADGASNATLLAQCLPAAMESVRAAIEQKELDGNDIEH